MPTRISSSLIKPISGSSNTNLGQDVSDIKTSVQSINSTVSTNTSDINSILSTISNLQGGSGGSGVQAVTSTTRPSTADQGTIIYETDTQKAYINTGSQNSPTWTEVATTSYVQGEGYATTSYVDGVASGLDVKASVRVASTANIPVTSATSTVLTLTSAVTAIDGVTLATNDRILLKDQTTGSQNGIYVYTNSTTLTRTTDADNTPSNEVTAGMFTFVAEGTANADSGWVLTTNDTVTLGTTSLAFAQFSGAGQITAGTGLTKSGNTLSITPLSPSKAVVTNAFGNLASVNTTSTELYYLSGVTSAIQTQIDGKQATVTGAATTITDSNLTASRAVVSNSSGKVAVSSVTSTELGYVSGVTSAIQTQIDGKQATVTGAATTITTSNLTASKALVSDASGKVSASSVTATELGYLAGVTSSIQSQLNYLQDLSGYTINYTYTNNVLTSETIYDKSVTPVLIKSTSYTYDANGNLATEVTTYSGKTITKTITYDSNSNITSIDVVVV